MKRILLSLLAIFFPWAIFLMEGKLGLFALGVVLQLSIIGWIPMSYIAWKHRNNLLSSSIEDTDGVSASSQDSHDEQNQDEAE